MRVLVDLTNSPHVPFFAPLVRLMRERGDEVHVTARRFAQTVELAERAGLKAVIVGAHGGTSRVGKARAAAGRTGALLRHARRLRRAAGGAPFDVMLSHGSTDLPLVARATGTPHVTCFDYEWAATMHRINCRLSWRVAVPEAIPPERLDRYGAAGKLARYPGLKEEYYLDPAALDPAAARAALDVGEGDVLAVLRPPADMALYHRGIHNDVFGAVLARAAGMAGVSTVVLARTDEQRAGLRAVIDAMEPAARARVRLPEHAVDGASLVAAADVVVSAGGTMNREAAALGVPVHTVFAGRIGGVDEALLAEGRLRELHDPADVELVARDRTAPMPALRDPADLLHVLLDGLPAALPTG